MSVDQLSSSPGVPATMQAARLDTQSHKLAVETVPVPAIGPDEALVKVSVCGICHSDLLAIEGLAPIALPVITPGHEAAGELAALGKPTPGWEVGQRVLLAAGRRCGECASCVNGYGGDQCRSPQLMSFHYDGAWAEYVAVPVSALVRVPNEVAIEHAAVVADAVSTPYAALVDTAGLRPAEAIGIWGLGGLGVHAVQIARMLGAATIIGLDPIEAARERALGLGADYVLDPADDSTVPRIWQLTGGLGLDVALDGAVTSASMSQANASVGTRGRIVLMGMSMETVDLGPEVMFAATNHRVFGHLGYAKHHLEQVLRLVAGGRLDLSQSVSGIVPLSETESGIRRLAANEGNPVRILVRP